MAPLGYFDPLGFCKVGDEKAFYEYRDAELKHGRIAMLASVGLLVQHFIHMDVPPYKAYLPTAPTSLGAIAVFYGPLGFFGLAPIFLALSVYLETIWAPQNQRAEPGNLGDPLKLNMYDTDMRNKEINNGRMAMISVLGIFAAEVATGKDAVEQLSGLGGLGGF